MNSRSIPLNGQSLKAARVRSLLTQLELAKAAETTATTVYRLETGRQRCSLSLLRRLSRSLNVSPVSIVSEEARPDFQ